MESINNKVREVILPLTSKFGSVASLNTTKRKARKMSGNGINPIMPNAADLVQWVMWDTYKVASGAAIGASFRFFVQPIGTNSKTKMDTNLEQVQRLPDPQWFNCTHIGFEFGSDMILADILLLLNNYYVEFWVGGKTYVEGHLSLFPSGTGLTGNPITTATTTTIATWTNGAPVLNNMFDLRLPGGIHLGDTTVSDGLTGITILQGQQFKVEVNAPGGSQTATAGGSGGQGVRLFCNLYGMISRGVQ